MQKITGVTDLQRCFRAVFDEVSRQGAPYVLARGSRPEAVLISYEDFVRFQQAELNADLPQDHVGADLSPAAKDPHKGAGK
jgi:prevent-host-death family protein